MKDAMSGFTVSLQSPADLGWQKNCPGQFRRNVAQHMKIAPQDVQTVVILAIPTKATKEAGAVGQGTLVAKDPRLLVLGKAIYSAAHILKIYGALVVNKTKNNNWLRRPGLKINQ